MRRRIKCGEGDSSACGVYRGGGARSDTFSHGNRRPHMANIRTNRVNTFFRTFFSLKRSVKENFTEILLESNKNINEIKKTWLLSIFFLFLKNIFNTKRKRFHLKGKFWQDFIN
jgi:hypothetical protein